MKTVLLTGGMGYIGSHTCVELLNTGFEVVILDNLVNSQISVLERIKQITKKSPIFIEGDVRDKTLVEKTLTQHQCTAVVHFAGLKAVGESVANPLQYYDNNVVGLIRLSEAMKNCQVKTLVFSSSATVYGEPQYLPIDEKHPLSATNPYGQTKLICETILQDLFQSDPNWRIAMLRYFNPVGAHESGLLGENPNGTPNNLMPYISQVAAGQLPFLRVFGDDYPTPDGTGVRDYIHVVDLAGGHVFALNFLSKNTPQVQPINLGTGNGFSVLEMLSAFEQTIGKSIKYQILPRRSGDVAVSFASTKLAQELLKWKASRDLNTMCADTWRWQKMDNHSRS
jgi:UDP-glucose 4-epimerase